MEEKKEDMGSIDELRDLIYELIEQMDEGELKALIELARILISDELMEDDEEDVASASGLVEGKTKSRDRVLWKKVIWSETIKKIKE